MIIKDFLVVTKNDNTYAFKLLDNIFTYYALKRNHYLLQTEPHKPMGALEVT